MPQTAYVKITGAKQGDITKDANTEKSIGSKAQPKFSGSIPVYEFQEITSVPVDPQSGQPSGTRKHDSVKITSELTKASPLLWQALSTGESLTIELTFQRVDAKGSTEDFYVIKWEAATLVGMDTHFPNTLDKTLNYLPYLETLSFTFRKVTWEHKAAGTSASDDWSKS